jgi:predicted nucleic acid-binding protein
MKLFLDANILVSILNKEFPLYTYTSSILSLVDNRKFDAFTSPLALAIAFYFSEKKSGTELAKKKIELLAEKMSISQTGQQEVLSFLQNKKIHDFEDGIQYYSVLNSHCTVIITNVISDFYFSAIEILKPEAFIMKYLM